jgi:iron(III) transport system substrate-binding protein
MKKGLVFVLCAVLLAGALAGCKGKTEGAASGPGKLVIYSPNTEDMVNKIIDRFKEKTGIEVEIISAGTGELWKRIESERNSPYADIIWGGAQATYTDTSLLEEYVSVNNKDLIPEYQNIGGKITLYCLDGSNILVNTSLIGNIRVEGYADLLNPALKGRLVMGDPTSSSSAFAQLTNMLLAMGGDYTSDRGWDYVRNLLVQLEGKIAQSSSAVHRGVAGGEYAAALTYEDPSASYVRDGAPVKIVYPREGTVFLAAATGIIKDCKNLDNAKQFMDFITSKEAQDIFGTQLTARPVRSDAALGTYMTPIQDIHLIFEDSAYVKEHRGEIVERFKSILTSIQ